LTLFSPWYSIVRRKSLNVWYKKDQTRFSRAEDGIAGSS
jgi:hypothetical protein